MSDRKVSFRMTFRLVTTLVLTTFAAVASYVGNLLPELAIMLVGLTGVVAWGLFEVFEYLNPPVRRDRDDQLRQALTPIITEFVDVVNASAKEAVLKELADRQVLAFSEEEKTQALEHLKTNLQAEAIRDHISRIEQQLTAQIRKDTLSLYFESTIGRLKQEAEELARRGLVNLVLGMGTALFGLVILGYIVLLASSHDTSQEPSAYFIPRASLVAVIEILAYFFLRLYKQSISDIKYYHNEITSIEMKRVSVQIALHSASQDLNDKVAMEIVRTERNAASSDGQRERKKPETTIVDVFKGLQNSAAKNEK